jgi:tetratricopeptide (TPR) repeat protein
MELLQSLRDKSLLLARPSARPAGAIRFGMYESIRAYAWNRLTSGEQEVVRKRHATHYLARAAEAFEREDLPWLNEEQDNVLAVHRRALRSRPTTPEDAVRALEASAALVRLLRDRGPHILAMPLVDAAFEAAAAAGVQGAVWARAHLVRGIARFCQGEHALAQTDLELASSLAGGDIRTRIEACSTLCFVAHFNRNASAVADYAEQAARYARETSDPNLQARALNILAFARSTTHLEAAIDIYRGALEQFERSGNSLVAIQLTLANLGSSYLELCKFDEAELHLRRCLQLVGPMERRRSEALCLVNLAFTLQGQNKDVEGMHAAREACEVASRVGDRLAATRAHLALGMALDAAGDVSHARAKYDEARRAAREGGYPIYEAVALAELARLDASEGELAPAAASFDAAESLAEGAPGLEGASVEVARGHLDLALADAARKAGDETRAASSFERARERARAGADALGEGAWGGYLLHRALTNLNRAVERWPAPSMHRKPSLRVGPDCRFFDMGGARVDLGRRGSSRRLLHELIQARLEAPGVALAVQSLVERVWPGDKSDPLAMGHRIHTIVNDLRRLGLRDVLATREDGYLIEARVEVVACGPDDS